MRGDSRLFGACVNTQLLDVSIQGCQKNRVTPISHRNSRRSVAVVIDGIVAYAGYICMNIHFVVTPQCSQKPGVLICGVQLTMAV